uniref:Putative secreted protein n=1 Tax=Anopheles marajoara TaxID=58244 RepID=A0A2M4C7F6_9DIPT
MSHPLLLCVFRLLPSPGAPPSNAVPNRICVNPMSSMIPVCCSCVSNCGGGGADGDGAAAAAACAGRVCLKRRRMTNRPDRALHDAENRHSRIYVESVASPGPAVRCRTISSVYPHGSV